jgi:hypothetical protein
MLTVIILAAILALCIEHDKSVIKLDNDLYEHSNY